MHLFVRNFNIRILSLEDKKYLFSNRGIFLFDIKSDTSQLKTNAPSILADPFLFVYNDELFLFYEHQDKWIGGKGRICMRKTKDLKTWDEEVTVLEEPFHLSFPNVFEENGHVYMLPETGGGLSISLYEAVDKTLTRWKLKKKLIEDTNPWYDSTILKKDDKYYLFTGRDNDIEQEQYLFVADDLLGPYLEHPCSPIAKGRDRGRNAGSIIRNDNSLYRPVQVCLNSYGEQTSIMKIEKITPKDYQEVLFSKNIYDTTIPGYEEGGHQYNIAKFKGHYIVSTDYRVKNYNVVELYRKIKNKLLK